MKGDLGSAKSFHGCNFYVLEGNAVADGDWITAGGVIGSVLDEARSDILDMNSLLRHPHPNMDLLARENAGPPDSSARKSL